MRSTLSLSELTVFSALSPAALASAVRDVASSIWRVISRMDAASSSDAPDTVSAFASATWAAAATLSEFADTFSDDPAI